MQTHFDELLAELPRLRRYARVLTNDAPLADEVVRVTLSYARHADRWTVPRTTPIVRHLSFVRRIYLDQFASQQHNGTPSSADLVTDSPARLHGDDRGLGGVHPRGGNELLELVLRLPLEDREIIVLVAVERLSYEDISALLNIPIATVLARLAKVRTSIRNGRLDANAAPNNGS
jgi:RNA polymerase sigma-70 factor, ECF subfamily